MSDYYVSSIIPEAIGILSLKYPKLKEDDLYLVLLAIGSKEYIDNQTDYDISVSSNVQFFSSSK